MPARYILEVLLDKSGANQGQTEPPRGDASITIPQTPKQMQIITKITHKHYFYSEKKYNLGSPCTDLNLPYFFLQPVGTSKGPFSDS